MDTLTHALVGTALSDALFRRRLGPAATPFALAAAALPDIDIVTYLVAPEFAWAYHRGYTHSFFPMLLVAPLIGVIGKRLAKGRESWIWWSLLALSCLFAHTLIDLVTSWGTMPWLPFSDARVSWDVAPILDVFVFSVTAASFVANRLLRRERVDHFPNPLAYPVVHRHPHRQRLADRMAGTTCLLLAVYLLLGWQQNRQTVRMAERELAARGVDAVEVRALPILFTYLAWDIVARDSGGTVYNAVHSSLSPERMEFMVFRSNKGEAITRALASPEGRLFTWYTQGMQVAEYDRKSEKVLLQDRRFFTLLAPARAQFTMEFDLDARGAVQTTRARQRGLEGVDITAELRALYELTRYGKRPLNSH